MLQAIAIDDEPLSLDIIKEYCSQVEFISLNKTFISINKAKDYLTEYPVDLIFLDIQMPTINGMDFFKSLTHRPMVIFTTAFSQYAAECFTIDAVDYLVKPIECGRFLKAVNKANEIHQFYLQKNETNAQFIFVRSEYQLIKVFIDDINYIEGLNDYIKIYTSDPQPVLSLISMKEILGKLPVNKFIRVHRSFIIPVSKITTSNYRTIHIGNTPIPIGDTYKSTIKDFLTRG